MPATKPRAYQVYDIDWKQAVRALSNSNINLASPGALVIDAVVLDPYDRVLLTAQTNATENGIYQVDSAQTLLVPAPDWVNIDSGLSSAVNSGLTVTVTEGAVYAQTTWTLTNANPIIIGVTDIVFEQVPEASDRIGNIYFDGATIELANGASETAIAIRPNGASGLAGITIPDDSAANLFSLNIFNFANTGNVKIDTNAGDWVFDYSGNLTATGYITANYFVGDGSMLSNTGGYGNSNVAEYLPTYTGNLVSLAGNVITSANLSAAYVIGNGRALQGISSISNGVSSVYIDTANDHVHIRSAAQQWVFDTNGVIKTPTTAAIEAEGTGIISLQVGNNSISEATVNLGYSNATSTYIQIIAEAEDERRAAFDVNAVDGSNHFARITTFDGISQNYYWLFSGNGVFLTPGDVIPVANGSRSLGNATNQWNDLYVSNNTIYLGNVPLAVTSANGLTIGGQAVLSNASNVSVTTSGNITAGYLLGNGSQLTGLPATYGNANVANYLPTYAGNISAGNINFVNGSTIKTAVNNVNMNANTGGAVEITTDGGNYTWSYDNYGWMYLPQAQAAYTPVANGSVLFGSEALVFKAGYANLIFDNTGNTTTGNYFLGNVQGLVGNITNLDSLNFAVENISALVANNGVNIGAGGFNNLLVLPTDVVIQNVPLSVAANIIGVTADNDGRIEWIGNSSGDGGGYTTLTLTPDDTVNGQVLVLDPTAPGHIHLRAPGIGGNVEQPTANIFLGPENTNFEITAQYGNAPEARIHSAGNTWTFDNTGNLTAPGNIIFTDNYVYGGNTFTSPETNGILKNFKWKFSDTVSGADTVTLQWNLLDTTFPQWYLTTNSQGNIYVFDGDAKTLGFIGNSTNSGTVTFGTAANNGAGSSNDIELTTVTGNAYIRTGSNSWKFDNTGNLTAPGSITTTGNIDAPYIYGDTSEANVFVGGTANISGNITAGNFIGAGSNIELVAQSEQWVFDTTGNLTLPTAGYLLVQTGIIGAGASPAPTLSGFSSIATTGLQGNISASGNLLAAGYANITGNINGSGATFSGNVTGNTGGYALGYRDIPQVAFTGNATLAATDAGKHYYSTLSTGNTLTIANNSAVSWTIGTAITVVNRGTGNITIAQGTGVSLYLAGNSTAANRTVSSYGMASLLNVAANVWMINGTGIA